MKQNIIQTKKGIALNQAFGAVLALILIGVLVIIAIFLFANLGATFTDINERVNNETPAWLNQSGYELNNATDCNFNTPVIVNIWNETSADLIPTANYTVTSDGIVRNATVDTNGGFGVNITYTYKQGGAACTATNTMITQFGSYPVLVGLVGTIIFLGIVIGVLVASFVFGGRREGV